MVFEYVYNRLRNEFGTVSSWAIWQEEGSTPKSNIGDLSIFDDSQQLLTKLNTEYIFVGLNAAVHNEPNPGNKAWGAFHSQDNKRQNDYKLRYCFKDSRFWGSYTTDVINGCPETNSAKATREYKDRKELREQSMNYLKKELQLIGGNPVLIAFGNDAFDILTKMQQEMPELKDKTIIKILHYSYRISKENYKSKVLEALKDV